MSRATRTPKPVESFGPEVLQALIEGSKREIILPLSYRKAVYFRSRINALRAEMRRQNHDMYKIVSQATVRIVWGEDAGLEVIPERRSATNVRFPTDKNANVKLIITPADKELGEALKKAGVEIKPLSLNNLISNTETTEPSEDILESYLKGEPHAAD